ncbi:glycosyltransferase [Tatumella citrea]|uniref:Glycosyltransferase 2-like domain-containing protein n=1 Tax=Tatumella citrea TaxID=53336 RepID=A0A1Y0LM20_TATCI|nr:glycosyltransferase [Tatumella citrea]ARU95066.1 hypothetical protein A7K98_15730 [Tatumella citrea]ARU99104.1 hypothetical protein A7K99_15715 [Tatumella citrea]
MSSICLNMIVKNESAIIAATLQNIIQHIPISCWVISDTGSADNTCDIIRQFFDEAGINGELYQDEWVDFAHNRNLALQRCHGKSDYVFFFDADDFFEGEINPGELTQHSYFMNMCDESKTTYYFRKLLIKNDPRFKWRGVLHEFIEDPVKDTGTLRGDYTVISGRKGARSLQKDKYLRDAQVLQAAYQKGADPDLQPRYAFYCAQSYHDAALYDEENRQQLYRNALHWYKVRLTEQGFSEEKYYSLMRIGLLYERLSDISAAVPFLLEAYQENPLRTESLYHLARIYNHLEKHHLAYQFALMAKKVKIPEGNFLFVNHDIYHYWIDYELMINAFKVKDFSASYFYARKLLLDDRNENMALRAIAVLRDLPVNLQSDSLRNKKLLRLSLDKYSQHTHVAELLSLLS